MEGKYNLKSPAVKRLMREVIELQEKTEEYSAEPVEENLFEWHFTIRGPLDSDFDGGIYHGRIILPPDYPMKPPSIMILTPNGRFETNKKICLSISGHHPESWQPSWSIRTAILAIIGFMPTPGKGAIGSLDYSSSERKILAKKSKDWECPACGKIINLLKPRTGSNDSVIVEASKVASEIDLKGDNPNKESSGDEEDETNGLPGNGVSNAVGSSEQGATGQNSIMPSDSVQTSMDDCSTPVLSCDLEQIPHLRKKPSDQNGSIQKDSGGQNVSVANAVPSMNQNTNRDNEFDIFMKILLLFIFMLIMRRVLNYCYPYIVESDALQ